MNKLMPSYEKLLEINTQLGERCNELEAIIREQELQIDEFFRASTLYRKLYMELYFKNKRQSLIKFLEQTDIHFLSQFHDFYEPDRWNLFLLKHFQLSVCHANKQTLHNGLQHFSGVFQQDNPLKVAQIVKYEGILKRTGIYFFI